MSYDHRNKTAAGKTFWDFIRDAEKAFYAEVVKELKKNKKFEDVSVGGDDRTPFVQFKGQDLADLDFDGLFHLVVDHNQVWVNISGNSVQRGKINYEGRKPLGQFDVAEAVEYIQYHFGLDRK